MAQITIEQTEEAMENWRWVAERTGQTVEELVSEQCEGVSSWCKGVWKFMNEPTPETSQYRMVKYEATPRPRRS